MKLGKFDLEQSLAQKVPKMATLALTAFLGMSANANAQSLIGQGPDPVDANGQLKRINDGSIGLSNGSKGEIQAIIDPDGPLGSYYVYSFNGDHLTTTVRRPTPTTVEKETTNSTLGAPVVPEVPAVFSTLLKSNGGDFWHMDVVNFSRIRENSLTTVKSSDVITPTNGGKPQFTINMPKTDFTADVQTAYATTNMPASVYLDSNQVIRVVMDGGKTPNTSLSTGVYTLALYLVNPVDPRVNNTFLMPINYFDLSKGPVLASTPGKDITLVPEKLGELEACITAYNTNSARISNSANTISLTRKTDMGGGVSKFCGDITQDKLEVGEDVIYDIALTPANGTESVMKERLRYWGAKACIDGTVCGQENQFTATLTGGVAIRLVPGRYIPKYKLFADVFDKETNKLVDSIDVDWNSGLGRYDEVYKFPNKGSFDVKTYYNVDGKKSTILGVFPVIVN